MPSQDRPHRFVYLLAAAQRRVDAAIAAKGKDMTAARAGLLLTLHPGQEIPMAAIGRALDLGAPALSGLIERTHQAGLIARRRDDSDARSWLVSLTEAGVDLRARAKEEARDLNATLAANFTEDELMIVARWLHSVREKFPRET